MTREPATIMKKLGIAVTNRDAFDNKIPQVDAGG
jgi:hypothetical protein